MSYTTQQLQAMSDFELNKAIALKLYPNATVVRSMPDDESVTIMTDEFTDIMVDYCNNANSVMPISFNRNIGLSPNGGSWTAFTLQKNWQIVDKQFMDKNPLRAIACLLLMMEK